MRSTAILGVLCAALLAALAACAPAGAANLLTNGGFETGDLTGWTNWGQDADNLFDGVFNLAWNNPPACGSPSTFGPHSGTYYLARYNPSVSCGPARSTLRGAVYQTVSVAANTPLYVQLWYATYHPHGGGAGVRVGLDPAFVPPVPPDLGSPSPQTVWIPALSPTGGANYAYSEGVYSKLQNTDPIIFPDSGTVTVWVQYTMTTNNVSEAQIVQVDDVRLGTTRTMEVKNSDIYSITATAANFTWDTYDGANLIPAIGQVFLYSDPAMQNLVKSSTPEALPVSQHSVNITGLTAGATYYVKMTNTAAGYEDGIGTDSFKMVAAPAAFTASATNVTDTSATIVWTTSIPADSRVDYGYAPSNLQFTNYDPTLVTNHSMVLTGLLPNTTYYFKVVSCAAPPDGCRKYFPTSPYPSFSTVPGPFFNGDFETVASEPRTLNDPIPGWTKAPGAFFQWFNSGEFSVPAHGGSLFAGIIVSGSKPLVGSMYQRFRTNPGDILCYTGYVWAEGVGVIDNSKTPPCQMDKHRFGEDYVMVGLDPTGGIDPNPGTNPNISWSSQRETLDWRQYVIQGPCTIHGNGTGWQKIGVMAKATGLAATLFLRAYSTYGAGWGFFCFDDFKAEAPTACTTVAAAKALPTDSPITLAGAAPADSPIVTYIGNQGLPDPTDNDGKPYFYIEDGDRTAAIKVTMADGLEFPSWLAVGKKVNVTGLVTWGMMRNRTFATSYDEQLRLDKPTGERVIRAIDVTDTGLTGTVKPIGMGNKNIAGGSSPDDWFSNAGVSDGSGPNTVGLLVKTWGKILEAGNDPDSLYNYIVIDDGAGVPCYSGPSSAPQPDRKGLYVSTGLTDYSAYVGKYVEVTGISGVKIDFDFDDPSYTVTPEAMKNVRFVKPLSEAEPDIVVLP